MAQRKSDEIIILREKASAKLTKELEELPNLSADELKMRYSENPMPDSGSNELENKLKKEIEELRTILDASPISIWNKDTKNKIIRVNKAAAKFVGREINEIEGRSANEIFPLESEKYYKDDLEVINTGNPKIGIIESLTAKGEARWVRTDKIPWYSSTGEIAGVIAFARDITELRISEQNLKNSEELFRRVITNAPISIFATDEKGIFTLHEGKAIERVGMKSGENVGVSAYELFSGIQVIEHNGKVSSGKSILDRVSKGEYLSGITELNGVKFDNQFAPIWDDNNKVVGLLGVATDITERKQAEETIKRNLAEITSYYDNAPIGLAVLDINLRFLRINNLLAEINGIPAAEHIGKPLKELLPTLAEQAKEVVSRIIKTNKPVTGIEFNGETAAQPGVKHIWLESWYPMRNDSGKIAGYMVIVQDITEHKQAEEKLQHSEHNLAEAERIGSTGSWDYDVVSDTANWSENMFRIFDVDPAMPKELVFKHFVENLVHPDDRSHILSVFQDALAGKSPYDLEYRIIKRDGSIRTIHALAETLFDANGKVVRMIGKVEDITERKRMEKIIKESEERYRLMLENSMDAILLTAPDGTIFSANQAACKMFQRTEVEICRAGRAGLANVDDPRLNKLINERERAGKAKGEITMIRKDGTIFNTELSSSTFTDSDGNLRTSIIIRDITERKKMELAVEEYKYFLRNVLDTNPNIIFVINKDGKIILSNKAFAEFYSTTVENIEGYTQQEIHKKYNLPTKDLEQWLAENLYVINTGLPLQFIVYSANRDGYGAWYRTRKIPIILPVGDKAALVVGEDITDLKKTEEDRRFLAEITLNISEGISLVRESDGIIVYTNSRYEEMFGYNPGELIGKHVQVLNASTANLTAYDTAREIIGFMQKQKSWKIEILNVKKDGTLFWTKASISQFDHPEYGKVLITIQMDIDNRKQAEIKLTEHEHELQQLSTELINAQETERKILSQELHDEVGQSLTALKINLASIVKNLNGDHDPKTQKRLQEMNEIIENLISQVHEISLNLRPAMLDVLGLLPTIKSYGNQFSERTGIFVHIENDININLEKEQEIHLYRIVQEAFTNVVKHAHAKNIYVNLSVKGNILVLSLHDDGCGFILSEKESIPHPGIGLIGMRERVNSLNGTMEINTSPKNGTKIEIQIPVNWKHE